MAPSFMTGHLADGGTGKEVISSVRAIRGANFKTILITGDTSSAARGPQGDESLYLLSKPVDPAALLKLLDKLLEPDGNDVPSASRV